MTMNKAFKELFGPIRAEEGLKDRTRAFLAERTRGDAKADTGMGRFRVYAAACACMLLMLFGGYRIYFTPIARISIDINPSIELGINRFDRVISVNGFNADGQELSNALDIKNRNYTEAIDQIINCDIITELLSGDEVMTITVIGPDGHQSAEILSGVETCTAEQSNTYCYFALPEEMAAAHETGLSCGKYRAFLELQLLDPEITPETVQGMTMREIQDLIRRLSGDDENDEVPYNNQGNGRHGYGGGHRNGKSQGRGRMGQ